MFEDEDKKIKSYMLYSDEKLLNDELNRINPDPRKRQEYEKYIADVVKNRNTDEDFYTRLRRLKQKLDQNLMIMYLI
ncbi:hypothetical protein NPA09_01870 [Mycoplasmopsis equigenitalium]|uniref:Uncharacterized protein n=1 Tax=Mycoplasmopsis equigenitalium TaxID=114883 RepID=A0ABY5J3I7_9BACT|nr:hypothetical protein [Mycoplasmopsis equigenitalium]UUD37299.1 hypothetical protein NPA09_01870 [Mycoplasmopsis equigenitalium]